ncbi:ankyrin repeat domain-containing protein [Anatilimnocola sp. NA78]|uniref:ankyrin repeat domain-containing protein n=1 Tax=Anatilimnocola sp. NA78 TaxID=3415683 RepID=UPI003CE48390
MADKSLIKAARSAIEKGDSLRLRSLFKEDPDLLNVDTVFGSWLHIATEYGQLEIVKHLLEMGQDIDCLGGIAESTPLHLAASEGQFEVAKYLLSKNAKLDVSAPDKNPLFAAVRSGHESIAKLLLDAGLDARVIYKGTSGKPKTALSYALDWGRQDIALLIENAGK